MWVHVIVTNDIPLLQRQLDSKQRIVALPLAIISASSIIAQMARRTSGLEIDRNQVMNRSRVAERTRRLVTNFALLYTFSEIFSEFSHNRKTIIDIGDEFT
jgi:hypothetical protein